MSRSPWFSKLVLLALPMLALRAQEEAPLPGPMPVPGAEAVAQPTISAARARLIESMRNRNTPRIVSNPQAQTNAVERKEIELPVAREAALPPGGPVALPPTSPFAVAAGPIGPTTNTITPRFRNTALDIVLQEVSQRTGKVILRDPKVANIAITLESRDSMTVTEFLRAVDSLLAMNNIAFVPFRENFLKVVPANTVPQQGIQIGLLPVVDIEEEDAVVSQVIELKHLDFTEAQTLITERLSPNAKVQPLERANALLITDARNNIKRVQEILGLIDRPADVREEVKVYPILNAKAADIKARLEELIADSQAELERQRGRTAATTSRTPVRTAPPGVIRPGTPIVPNVPVAPVSASGDASVSPGLIRGKVQIVADDRTNILLILSRPENDKFFEDMIATLDKKVDPEITVRVYPLEFADATEAAATLNELIGAATQEQQPGAGTVTPGQQPGGTARAGQSIRDFIQQRNAQQTDAGTEPPNRVATNIGEISESTRILADQRTNSLVLMGRNSDLDLLMDVIRRIDIMLAQVMVRAVIMEVNLNNNFAYGIDWLQSGMTVNNLETVNGVPVRTPVAAFGGGQNLSSSSTEFRDAASVARDVALAPGGLSYFTTFYDLNIDAVIRLAQGSSDAKVIATPIILTTDNTEANIVVGERRAIPTTTATTIGGSVQSAFEYQNIGLDLSVKPRINPQKVVLMEVKQTAENVGGTTRIDGNDVPIITTRQLAATVSIQSGGTLVLGGLVREDVRESMTKVPVLGSIPLLGALFRSKSKENVRTELLVLISPQVILSAEEANAMTKQLKGATEIGNQTWYRGWESPAEAAASAKP